MYRKESGGFLMSTLQGSIGDTHENPNAFNKPNLVLSPEVSIFNSSYIQLISAG